MATTRPPDRAEHPPTAIAHRVTPPLGRRVLANLATAELVEDAIRSGEGLLAAEGPLVVRTGHHTGRSPKDKFIVDEPSSTDKIWWGDVNHPISQEHYDRLRARLVAYCAEKDLYSQDLLIGADPHHRRRLRVYTETAWASIFARNLFRRPRKAELHGFEPNFTIICVPSFHADPATEGTRSETAILLHLERMEIIIVGTEYAGEIKKSAFTVMNYLMPDEGVLPMHSSVNVGQEGDSAVFFGLSGTGKTTLSADPERRLIGDDEHGWGDRGLFNFEGGCYAKTIRLSPMYEPDIFQTTRRFGTILENVDVDPVTRELDLDSERFTENTRAAYPLNFIGNADATGMTVQPRTVILLTADAFGVLPPIARLTHAQAAYHFISGYTAKLAGTEVGIKEPKATFSACFGAPFMPRHPGEYARMLTERLAHQNAEVWLVNTGWTGGPYGVGERMNIAHTRSMVRAALDGRLAHVHTRTDPTFGFEVPLRCPDVPASFLDPRSTWKDRDAYDQAAHRLATMFAANFKAFEDGVAEDIRAAGPIVTGPPTNGLELSGPGEG
ncbi:MAG TPA: phosphoenolpyruvate carboxykinase (ATP) [Candidatus Limnocylindrales bacterium]|nr:phosphoenolpyruvate carboxykinase (ATP) [Candidatus Limnocylindrales bacterium]